MTTQWIRIRGYVRLLTWADACGNVLGMPRAARVAPGGMIFHVLNRGNDQRTIFGNEHDYAAFLRLFGQTQESVPMRVLAYCLLEGIRGRGSFLA